MLRTAQLCDFGHSCLVESVGQPDSFRGTEGYQAPELHHGPNWSPAADVFSAGVVMHALLANYLVRWSMGQPDMRGRNFGRISTPSKMLLKVGLSLSRTQQLPRPILSARARAPRPQALVALRPRERATVAQATSALAEIAARTRELATGAASRPHALQAEGQPGWLRRGLGQHGYTLMDLASLDLGTPLGTRVDSASVAVPRVARCASPCHVARCACTTAAGALGAVGAVGSVGAAGAAGAAEAAGAEAEVEAGAVAAAGSALPPDPAPCGVHFPLRGDFSPAARR